MNKLKLILSYIWLGLIFIPIPIPNLYSFFSLILLIFFPIRIPIKQIIICSIVILYIVFNSIFLGVVNEFFIRYFLLILEGLITLLIFFNHFKNENPRKIGYIFVFLSFASIIFGLFQYYLGYGREYLIFDGLEYTNYRRPIPNGVDPNYYFINSIFPLVFLFNNKKVKESLKSIVFDAFLTSFFILNVFLVGSKAGLLVLLFIILLSLLVNFKNSLKSIVIIMFFSIVPLFFAFDIISFSFIRFEGLLSNNLSIVTTHRDKVWSESFDLFSKNSFFGTGLGQTVKYLSSNRSFLEIGAGTSHNSFIHILSELGIVGAVLYSLIFISGINFKNKFSVILWSAICIMLLSVDAFYTKILFIYLGFSIILKLNEKNHSNINL